MKYLKGMYGQYTELLNTTVGGTQNYKEQRNKNHVLRHNN